MTNVVNEAVSRIFDDSLLRPFFDGSIPVGSANIVDNATLSEALVESLVEFLGMPGMFTCTQVNFFFNFMCWVAFVFLSFLLFYLYFGNFFFFSNIAFNSI